MNVIRLGNKLVGNGFPCYFIAEIGTSFKNFDEAKRLIDSAIEIGVDAVKIQTFQAETVTTKSNFFDMEATGNVSQYELLKKIEIPKELQKKVIQYANDCGITIFSAPSHINDLKFMKELGISIYKIGSDLACHIPLLKEVAKLGKPIILSTGMCTMNEVKDSVNSILSTGNKQLVLLHCISDYPTKPEECNLRAITTMKNEFDLPVGYSDHTIGISASLTAAIMGANVIEKHFRDERNSPGPDDIHSLKKEEFNELIKSVRRSEEINGDGIKKPSKSEEKNRLTNRVSIVALTSIPKGTEISEKMIDIRRPGNGIEPKNFWKIIGKKTKIDISKDEPLKFDYLE